MSSQKNVQPLTVATQHTKNNKGLNDDDDDDNDNKDDFLNYLYSDLKSSVLKNYIQGLQDV